MPGRCLLPAPIRNRRGFVRDHTDGRAGTEMVSHPGRSGIYAPSTETNCGPKNETTPAPTTITHVIRARIIAGQRRWRWDLNPRKGCPFTRFRGVRPRPLGDST